MGREDFLTKEKGVFCNTPFILYLTLSFSLIVDIAQNFLAGSLIHAALDLGMVE